MKVERTGILLCLVGPAGSGKTFLGENLVKAQAGAISYSVSVTSRPPRPNEINGVHYHFVSRADFEAKVANGEFFEWEEVHGNLYGTPLRTIEDSVKEGRDLLMDLDIKGALNIKSSFPKNAILIFLVPPSVEVLLARLRNREGTTEEDLVRRLETARAEYELVKKTVRDGVIVDYLIVNDVIEEAFTTLSSILVAERARLLRFSRDAIARLCSLGD